MSRKRKKNYKDEKAFQLYAQYYYHKIYEEISSGVQKELYDGGFGRDLPPAKLIRTKRFKNEVKEKLEKNPFMMAYNAGHPESAAAFLEDYLEKAPVLRSIVSGKKSLSPSKMMQRYDKFVHRERELAEQEILRNNILNRIPDRLPDLYPAARAKKRQFILHVGPTNSGKTYEAIEALKNADSGVYLGPLRLLAYEQYTKLNMEDIPCNLVTGEEESYIEYARHRASTVEMLPFDEEYQCAVIDEAQMISDSERGGAWTAAILGVCADEVHVCMAPEAEQCVIRMIEDCGDEYRVVYHERKTPLLYDEKPFHFPKSVEKGDALIVFSRRDVHSVASVLQSKGIRCSVIYGNLPHDVRHTQANNFMYGKTDVVVATDAIGMGMNLPIRRIVFLENVKFDGKSERGLYDYEVKQIAGRAGRFGIYDTGLYNSIFQEWDLQEAVKSRTPEIPKAFVDFPKSLKLVGDKLSETMRQWNSISISEGYERGNIDREIALAEKAEKYTDNRELIYQFATIPFDEKDEVLMQMWFDMLYSRIDDFPYIYPKVRADRHHTDDNEELRSLEHRYKICDMLFYYKRRFEPDRFTWIDEKKGEISGRIIEILNKQRLAPRRCMQCGRKLPWNYRYRVCNQCRDAARRYR